MGPNSFRERYSPPGRALPISFAPHDTASTVKNHSRCCSPARPHTLCVVDHQCQVGGLSRQPTGAVARKIPLPIQGRSYNPFLCIGLDVRVEGVDPICSFRFANDSFCRRFFFVSFLLVPLYLKGLWEVLRDREQEKGDVRDIVSQIVVLAITEAAPTSTVRMKGGARMVTFKINSDQPYYRNGCLVKRVKTRQTIGLSTTECAIVGWNAARLVCKLTFALLFKQNPYRLP